jgi:hypothetical protein
MATLMALHIHTSDRINFKLCRRKWNYESPLRMNLEQKDKFSHYFWSGTGLHYALEMYHGYGKDPVQAFNDYYSCFKPDDLPMECHAFAEMFPEMMDYYLNNWLPKRPVYNTLFIDGKPQVEVEVILELKELSKIAGEPVYYSMRFDRVVEDEYNRLWIMDYKTVASFDSDKLETDQQISVYSWGAELYYNRPVEGFVYLQFKKALIKEPKVLKKPAGAISKDTRQNTTYEKYLEALLTAYGSLEDTPSDNLVTLEYFRELENELGDNFIRYDLVRRNKSNKHKQYQLLLAEGKEMLNKDLPIYPNFTRECYRFCDFRTPCLAEDDGSDVQFLLDNNYQPRQNDNDKWRKQLEQNKKGETNDREERQ